MSDVNIDIILDSIKDKGLEAIKKEFKAIFESAINDSNDFIQDQAKRLYQALSYYHQGLIDKEDVSTLLKKQKQVAQIYANKNAIETRIRVQKLVYTLLDISIDIILKALIPI